LNIPVGAMVELANLRNAAWLNAQLAEVINVDHDRRRYEIRLNSDNSIKKVKAENVILPTGSSEKKENMRMGVPKGTRIELCNLHTAKALNGERAVIISRDEGSDRYEIRMEHDGATKQVRRENFRIIAQPMM